MDQVTRGWLIYELTDSALQLGLVRGVQAIPFLLLSPVAGSVADRYSRKMQVVLTQIANGLLFAVTALLIFTGQIRPWHVYVTAVLMAIVQVFLQPARAALISDAVPANNLTNAIGLNAVVFNVARSTGPALAGVLIAKFGTGGAYFVQAVFFFLATIWTTQLRSAEALWRRRPRSPGSSGILRPKHYRRMEIQLEERNRAHRSPHRDVGLVAHCPVHDAPAGFCTRYLQVGATGQGLLLTAMGRGCSGAAPFSSLPPAIACHGACLMLVSVTLYGFIIVMFAASHWFWLSMVLMVIVGLCHVHSHALVQTIIQSYSPSEFRGRTMAIFHMSQVVMTAGAMLFGALSSMVGAQWAVASMGAVGALIMIGISLALPGARFIR